MKTRTFVVAVLLALGVLGALALRRSQVPAAPQPSTPVADESTASANASAPVPASRARARSATRDVAMTLPRELERTNYVERLLKGESLPVKLEQLTGYLQANQRSPESLLAAYRATGEKALLDEAMATYPRDPLVVYTSWYRTPSAANSPESIQARRQALDTLKEIAPDNALANYLSAGNYFASGQPERAIQEMQIGSAKLTYDDYTQEGMQSMTEAYMAAGYSEAESKLAANTGALLPQLGELKSDGVRLAELAKSYQQAGDSASAQTMLQMCQDLGRRLDDRNSTTLIQQLVGISIERIGLDAAKGMATDADGTQAIQNRIDALVQERQDIKAMVAGNQIETWLQTASPQDVVAFCDRERTFGEVKALQWLATRNANPRP
jgi:hypothetical protein